MPLDIYDKVMMLSKRRGFIYPSFEIYGGCAGFMTMAHWVLDLSKILRIYGEVFTY